MVLQDNLCKFVEVLQTLSTGCFCGKARAKALEMFGWRRPEAGEHSELSSYGGRPEAGAEAEYIYVFQISCKAAVSVAEAQRSQNPNGRVTRCFGET